MTKNIKKHARPTSRMSKKSVAKTALLNHAHSENVTAAFSSRLDFSRFKGLSKRLIHDYVLPMTRKLENRLQRLEQSL